MKNQYVKPELSIEEFSANEHVAACGDTNRVYKFECNIGYFGTLYEDTNNNGVLDRNDTRRIHEYANSYWGCKKYHEASTDGVFKKGWVANSRSSYDSKNVTWTPVIIWYDGGTSVKNIHVTDKINMDEWTTIKS